MEEDYSSDCDMCSKRKPSLEVTFCNVCGVDYCADCKYTHDAQHDFAVERSTYSVVEFVATSELLYSRDDRRYHNGAYVCLRCSGDAPTPKQVVHDLGCPVRIAQTLLREFEKNS